MPSSAEDAPLLSTIRTLEIVRDGYPRAPRGDLDCAFTCLRHTQQHIMDASRPSTRFTPASARPRGSRACSRPTSGAQNESAWRSDRAAGSFRTRSQTVNDRRPQRLASTGSRQLRRRQASRSSAPARPRRGHASAPGCALRTRAVPTPARAGSPRGSLAAQPDAAAGPIGAVVDAAAHGISTVSAAARGGRRRGTRVVRGARARKRHDQQQQQTIHQLFLRLRRTGSSSADGFSIGPRSAIASAMTLATSALDGSRSWS